MGEAIRIEDDGPVRHLVLCRPDELNTITVALRDELDAALDGADRDGDMRVVLHSVSKPTVAAVQGWCVAGGTT